LNTAPVLDGSIQQQERREKLLLLQQILDEQQHEDLLHDSRKNHHSKGKDGKGAKGSSARKRLAELENRRAQSPPKSAASDLLFSSTDQEDMMHMRPLAQEAGLSAWLNFIQ
jgi:hypothetical protein